MSKLKPECPTCPMVEVSPGRYVCKRCGYVKDYGRRVSRGKHAPRMSVLWAIFHPRMSIERYEQALDIIIEQRSVLQGFFR